MTKREKKVSKPAAGLEPTIFWFEAKRVSHYATRAPLGDDMGKGREEREEEREERISRRAAADAAAAESKQSRESRCSRV